jgi:hypothetical protein
MIIFRLQAFKPWQLIALYPTRWVDPKACVEQDRKGTYGVTLRRVLATIVAVDKQ